MNEYKDKMLALAMGKKVICDDDFLNYVESFGKFARSIPNPNRLGVLDKYVAWIGPKTDLNQGN